MPCRAGRRGETLEAWCPANGRDDLLEEWDDPSKGPHEVTWGSATVRVRWKCKESECGHTWQDLTNFARNVIQRMFNRRILMQVKRYDVATTTRRRRKGRMRRRRRRHSPEDTRVQIAFKLRYMTLDDIASNVRQALPRGTPRLGTAPARRTAGARRARGECRQPPTTSRCIA
jgi:hypothetical protein